MRNTNKISAEPTITFDGEKLVVDAGFKPWDCVAFCSIVSLIGLCLALLLGCIGTFAVIEIIRESVNLKNIARMLLAVLFFHGGCLFSTFIAHGFASGMLPFHCEYDVKSGRYIGGTIINRKTLVLSGGAVLMIEPLCIRGNWGYVIRLMSNKRKCVIYPEEMIGERLRAINYARGTARRLQEMIGNVRIEESRRWGCKT